MSVYATDGAINVTVVDGSTRTGLYAADGSLNVVQAPSPVTAPIGVYHACGAFNVTVASGTDPLPRNAPDGSYYVQTTNTLSGPLYVNVVSGAFV